MGFCMTPVNTEALSMLLDSGGVCAPHASNYNTGFAVVMPSERGTAFVSPLNFHHITLLAKSWIGRLKQRACEK